jgi:hypothetical protein
MCNWAEIRKTFPAAALILALLFLAVVGTQFVILAKANPYIRMGEGPPPADANPPEITILSPENNKTYSPNNVSLNFNVSAGDLFLSRVYYKADWQEDTTCVYKYYNPDPNNISPPISDFSYSLRLTGVPEGKHNIVITAIEWGSYVDGIYSYEFRMNGSSSISFIVDGVPPKVSGLSVENKTYDTSDVPLNFTVNESVSQISYVLDGQENVTIGGNMTLSGLSDGAHNVTVYARDTAGNIGTSETIYFTVKVPFPTTWVVAPIASVAVAGVGLLVYFKKRKR